MTVRARGRLGLGACLLGASLGLGVGDAAGARHLLAAVGDVTSQSAVVWVRAEGGGPVAVEVQAAGGGPPAVRAIRVTRRSDFTGQVAVDGLDPGTRYRYRVRGASDVVEGEFVTAPASDEATRVRFLWSGDLGGGGYCRRIDEGYRIFRPMAGLRPDFFLFVGDTVYADRRCDRPGVVPGAAFVARTLAEFQARHRYNREDVALRELLRATSVYAIWDDHEVKNDFAGPTEPLMPIGRQAFLDYFPIARPAEEPTRLYRKFRWGRLLEVFILDTRQYRSPNTDLDGPGKTMLGPAQRRWLVDNVAASTATWKLVVSSVPLAIPTGRRERRDSWTGANVFGEPEEGRGFATERDLLLRAFRDRGVQNLVFVAADVHHAELIRHHPTLEWSFHEFIAGPLSATLGIPRPLDRTLGSRSLFARGGVNNFGEVEIEPGMLTVRIYDEDGARLFVHTIGPEGSP